jgi:outer membrane protein
MGFSLSQLITDFRRTALSVASAGETARGREATAQATTAEIRLQVRVAYYRALQAEAAMAVAEQVQKSRQLLLRQVKAFADSELRSIVDVGFAEVRLSEAELLIIRTDNERHAALIELASAMGLDAPSDWTLEEPAVPAAKLSVDEAIEHAIRQRPDLAALRHHLEAARKQLESDRRLNLPSVGAVGIAGYIPAGDPRLRPRYAGAAVNITVPVLNGNLFAARRQESEARAIAVEKQQRDLLVRLRAAVRLSYLNFATAQSNMETARKLQDQAQRTLRLSEARYSAGLGTIVEYNQAQVDVVSAQLAYAAARYEAGMRMARLEFEIGNLI